MENTTMTTTEFDPRDHDLSTSDGIEHAIDELAQQMAGLTEDDDLFWIYNSIDTDLHVALERLVDHDHADRI